MKEYPVTFSRPEIRAILGGQKTQFRRVIKPQPADGLSWRGVISWAMIKADEGKHLFTDRYPCARQAQRIRCPYGLPGDRLWVQELWSPYGTRAIYDADTDPATKEMIKRAGYTGIGSWMPAVTMPRKLSRILLHNQSVRVERLQDITEEGATAEGCGALSERCSRDLIFGWDDWPEYHQSHRENFQCLWQSINGPGSWAENLWVWVVEFRVVEGGVE